MATRASNRGTLNQRPGRFAVIHSEHDEPAAARPSRYHREIARSILTRNQSPDLHFDTSLNPYRGCTHACAYCYARAFHEYLDLGAGSDFERKIRIKPQAARLLTDEAAEGAQLHPVRLGHRCLGQQAVGRVSPADAAHEEPFRWLRAQRVRTHTRNTSHTAGTVGGSGAHEAELLQ